MVTPLGGDCYLCFDNRSLTMTSYVINLDKRVERWYYVREHLAEVGIKPIRFSAIEAKPGWVGCRESHLRILSMTPPNDIVAIYEDDVKFLEPWESVLTSISQLPPLWDALYLGASPKEPQKRVDNNLFRLKNSHVAHAIIWNRREGGAVEYILSHQSDIRKIDDFYAHEVQPKFNCYVTYPICATQRQFQSDTCIRSDVSTIDKNYTKYITPHAQSNTPL